MGVEGYRDIHQAINDVRLIFKNALTYNRPEARAAQHARSLGTFFEDQLQSIDSTLSSALHRAFLAAEAPMQPRGGSSQSQKGPTKESLLGLVRSWHRLSAEQLTSVTEMLLNLCPAACSCSYASAEAGDKLPQLHVSLEKIDDRTCRSLSEMMNKFLLEAPLKKERGKDRERERRDRRREREVEKREREETMDGGGPEAAAEREGEGEREVKMEEGPMEVLTEEKQKPAKEDEVIEAKETLQQPVECASEVEEGEVPEDGPVGEGVEKMDVVEAKEGKDSSESHRPQEGPSREAMEPGHLHRDRERDRDRADGDWNRGRDREREKEKERDRTWGDWPRERDRERDREWEGRRRADSRDRDRDRDGGRRRGDSRDRDRDRSRWKAGHR